jgi:hypothetical protein
MQGHVAVYVKHAHQAGKTGCIAPATIARQHHLGKRSLRHPDASGSKKREFVQVPNAARHAGASS